MNKLLFIAIKSDNLICFWKVVDTLSSWVDKKWAVCHGKLMNIISPPFLFLLPFWLVFTQECAIPLPRIITAQHGHTSTAAEVLPCRSATIMVILPSYHEYYRCNENIPAIIKKIIHYSLGVALVTANQFQDLDHFRMHLQTFIATKGMNSGIFIHYGQKMTLSISDLKTLLLF